MNIENYLDWRQAFLKLPIGDDLSTPRGDCIVSDRIIIQDNVKPDWHLKNRALEDAEFKLMFYGADMDKTMKDKLYGNDEELYQAYKSLNISSLVTNGKRRLSRKNIIFNKECCLCYWQLHGDMLTVISRSWDIQRAGLSDLVIINRIAQLLDCKRIYVIGLCNHVYKDRENIARRHDENSCV